MMLEQMIIEILKRGDTNPRDIAWQLGIRVEVVKEVLNRLQYLGFVENHNCS
jgi:predicted transcriptional regulator